MKKYIKNKNARMGVYVLLVVLAIIAVTALIISFNKQRELEAERLRQLQKEQQISQEIDKELDKIEALPANPQAALRGLTYSGSGLQVKSQQEGRAVIVESVVLERPGFIAVYTGDGVPDTLLNVSPFLVRGVHPLVSIAIPDPLEAGQTYYITIHFDENDNGLFENAYDLPIASDSGKIITAEFGV